MHVATARRPGYKSEQFHPDDIHSNNKPLAERLSDAFSEACRTFHRPLHLPKRQDANFRQNPDR